jgi:hypothetical protein
MAICVFARLKRHAGCGKFALRGLSQSLAKEFRPAGVHIAHMIIDGAIGDRRLAKTHHIIHEFLFPPRLGLSLP